METYGKANWLTRILRATRKLKKSGYIRMPEISNLNEYDTHAEEY